MPFEALLVSGTLAAERYTLSYAPSLRYAARATPRRLRAPWRLQAVGVGAVEGGDWLIPGDRDLGNLPGARRELDSLRSALPGRVDLRVGREATPARLLDALRDARILHVATHAVADLEDPGRSRLLLARGESGSSYLFLPGLEGGAWPQVELAVLSACETEAGRLVAAEGVSSFGRSLLAGGAETVVSSLWRVDDRSTARLMDAFYRALGRGLPRAEALREARLQLLRQGGADAHPAHWAGFVILGEGDAPLGRVLSWPLLLTAAAALLGLAAWILLRFRQ
jgi:CHAT domain-containing protein